MYIGSSIVDCGSTWESSILSVPSKQIFHELSWETMTYKTENKHTVKSSNVLTALTTGNLKSIRNNARMNGFGRVSVYFL